MAGLCEDAGKGCWKEVWNEVFWLRIDCRVLFILEVMGVYGSFALGKWWMG